MINHTTYRDANTGIKSAAKLLVIALAFILLASFKQTSAQSSSVSIPLDTDSYKIVVSEDGIYQVTYEELMAAGMDVASIDPTTFEMMHRGMPMAYELVGNGDNVFEAGEAVRFFGSAFGQELAHDSDGLDSRQVHTDSKHDQLYVNENYYWLWANGTPTTVQSRLSDPGGTAVDSWRSTLVFEEDLNFNFTNSNEWDGYDYEADPWFWARMASNPAGVTLGGVWTTPKPATNITPEMGQSFREFTVEVIDPIAGGADAIMTTEVFSFCEPSQVETHTFGASLNGEQHIDQWTDRYGRSFDQMIPASTLIDGDNLLRYDALTPPEDIKNADVCGTQRLNSDLLHPNRSILEYDRQLAAVDDGLLFTYASAGTHDFMVSNFTTGSTDSAIVWDVTDRAMPSAITLSDADIADNGGTFTWTIGDENLANGEYIATSVTKTPDSLSQYVASDLTKADVEWLAVVHENFMPEAQRMADYRGGTTTDVTLSDGTTVSVLVEHPRNTHVVDISDIANQYGYGYNIPQAIQAYFTDAYTNWSNGELKYGILFGDGTINPRQLPCVEQCNDRGEWDITFESFIPTDLQFYDRFAGFIPTDHSFANLVDDGSATGPIPEIGVGRFAVNTLEEASNMVDKIVLYEYNQQEGAEYLENLVFIADNADGGGDFCQTTRDVADNPDFVDQFDTYVDGSSASGGNPYCMDTYMADVYVAEGIENPTDDQKVAAERTSKIPMRDDILGEINSTGAAIVNYRGHGGRFALSGIINANRDVDGLESDAALVGGFFNNNDRPMVWISADCLDGDFAYPSARESALSERMLRLGEMAGTAGHWSSTGLGFDREHTALHQGFYEGLYTLDADGNPRGPYTIGDAIVYSKARYLNNELGNVAEIWAFTYQGDPAMAMPDAAYVEGFGDIIPEPTAATVSSTEVASVVIYLPIVASAALVATTIVASTRRHNLID